MDFDIPINGVPVGIRVLLIVLVPPISWVSASLVEWLVERAIS